EQCSQPRFGHRRPSTWRPPRTRPRRPPRAGGPAERAVRRHEVRLLLLRLADRHRDRRPADRPAGGDRGRPRPQRHLRSPAGGQPEHPDRRPGQRHRAAGRRADRLLRRRLRGGSDGSLQRPQAGLRRLAVGDHLHHRHRGDRVHRRRHRQPAEPDERAAGSAEPRDAGRRQPDHRGGHRGDQPGRCPPRRSGRHALPPQGRPGGLRGDL
ncbi:MAG: hypothetical protein AVDCRST_MAG61-1621, partial [uncultured Friedmanniella sp.]